MTGKTYTSAIKRLEGVPEIFTGGDLTILFGWTSQVASTYLANWKRAGLVKSLGGRSDVHMNMVAKRQANPELALIRAYPMAVKVGADVLREAGWTTQIPRLPEVVVPRPGPIYKIDGFDLSGRRQKWFSSARPGMVISSGSLARLRPAWALADMVARALDGRVRNTWLLAPDDLDFEEAGRDPDLAAASKAFGLKEDALTAARYEQIVDSLNKLPASEKTGTMPIAPGQGRAALAHAGGV